MKITRIKTVIDRLEKNPKLMKSKFKQLLAEPTQRVTRYSIMMDAVSKYQEHVQPDEYYDVLMATNATRKVLIWYKNVFKRSWELFTCKMGINTGVRPRLYIETSPCKYVQRF